MFVFRKILIKTVRFNSGILILIQRKTTTCFEDYSRNNVDN